MTMRLIVDGVRVGINDAVTFAVQCYAGKYDRSGWPVILHSIRIAMKQTTDEGVIAALLHDLVEDGFCTLQKVEDEFGEDVAEIVGLLTREAGQSYMDYIKRLAPNHTASMVKLADIEDNTDVRRMDAKAAERSHMYLKAYEYICTVWDIERKLTIGHR